MQLELKRIAQKTAYTIGKLYVDGIYLCDTLEPPVRPAGVKIAGETAIPVGTYKIQVTPSPRFKRDLPRLFDVPGFEGVLIHRGNTVADTAGCILVGENKQVGMVLNSAPYELKLVELLKFEKNVTIKIS